MDFFDCVVPDDPFDFLELDDLYNVKYVDCDFNCHELPSAENCPSPTAYNTSVQGGIDTCLFDDPGDIAECFPVIFDFAFSF